MVNMNDQANKQNDYGLVLIVRTKLTFCILLFRIHFVSNLRVHVYDMDFVETCSIITTLLLVLSK